MAKLSRKHCKLCSGQMEEAGDMERCLQCGAEFSVNTGVLLNKTALERVAERGGAPRAISRPTVPRKRPPSSMDPVRFRTAGGGFGIGSARGSGRDNLGTWETPTPIRKPGRRIPRQSVGRFPRKPEHDIFHNRKGYQVIIYDIPFKNLEDVRCEVINDILVVESLLEGFDFLQKFSLPEDIIASSIKTGLKNSILNICFEKKQRREESEQ